MKIRIDANPIGALKIIDELPDAKLAMIEGLNGIGKTLSIRLLQVCTGGMPYRLGSPAWQGLCEGLGSFRVTARGLRGADEVVWSADSRDWLAFADAEPQTQWFRELTIDGREASLMQVRALLSVHRLAGDEGIIETLADLAADGATTVRRWGAVHVAPDASPLAQLEQRVDEASELLGRWTPERYAGAATALQQIREELRRLHVEWRDAEEARRDLSAATRVAERLVGLRARAPGLERELAEVETEAEEARARRERAQSELTRLAAQTARAEPVRKEIRNARRTLERNRAKLEDALRHAAVSAAAAELPRDLDEIEGILASTRQRIADLESERDTLDSAPAMAELIGRLTPQLGDAVEHGLADEVVAHDLESGVQLSVRQTKAAMETRREFLEAQPPPSEVEALAERIAEAEGVLRAAEEVLSALQDVSVLARRVEDNERRLDDALAKDSGDLGERLRILDAERREADEALLELAARRASVLQQLGVAGDGTTEEALSEQLSAMCSELGVQQGDLHDALERHDVRATDLANRIREVEAEEVEQAEELAQATRAIRRSDAELAESPQLAWLRSGLAMADDRRRTDEQRLEALARAHGAVERLAIRLERHRTQIGAVEAALTALSQQIVGQTTVEPKYMVELRAWLADRFANWFNDPRVLSQLLPGTEGQADIDLERRTVTWQEQGGVIRTRPLEAFSSGEQAFAYTKARLSRLDEDSVAHANRLIVLDEFGAFIARDRLSVLQDYLAERSKERAGDQTLVILPLSTDYESLAATTTGPDGERYQRMAEEIQSRRYAVRVIVR